MRWTPVLMSILAISQPLGVPDWIAEFQLTAHAADGQHWTHFGITVDQSDVDLRQAHEICSGHPKPAGFHQSPMPTAFWPEPCESAEQEYEHSGAKAKWDEIERRDEASQAESVRKAVGK